ncbi:MAG: hypothetical protein LBS39_05170, partial [Campylobacteraceae bacterium]|nr:hypothetical protein [Campylobacteraceae bacterium]
MRIEEKCKKKLLVEGNDDQHIILALCKKFNIGEVFDVVDCEGIEKLYKEIPIRLKQSGIQAIGIIIDADDDIKNRYDKIKKILPSMPSILLEEKSTITIQNGIKVGIWVMPNNNLNGTIEDFISFLVPEDDKLMPIVDLTLENIEKKELNKYSTQYKSKAKIHTWLAWQENPGTPMGS